MQPAVHLLLGFPGTGKFTIAKALVEEIASRGGVARLVDSHYVNNPIFGVINQDGMTPLPNAVWPLIRDVRAAILTAIEEIAPPDWTFVFTNFVTAARMAPDIQEYFDRLDGIAKARGSRLRVTRLTCEAEENCRRVVGEDRVRRMKSTNADWIARLHREEALCDPPDFDSVTLDVTGITPEQAAREILDRHGG